MTLNNRIFFPPFWRGQRDNNIIIVLCEMKNVDELLLLYIYSVWRVMKGQGGGGLCRPPIERLDRYLSIYTYISLLQAAEYNVH